MTAVKLSNTYNMQLLNEQNWITQFLYYFKSNQIQCRHTRDVFGCFRIWLQSGAVTISDFGYNIMEAKQIRNDDIVAVSIQLYLKMWAIKSISDGFFFFFFGN